MDAALELHSVLDADWGSAEDALKAVLLTSELRSEVLACINEFVDEMSENYKAIAGQALEQIHTNEIILTTGRSSTVVSFLIAAAAKRKFEVIVAETAPGYEGHKAAKLLQQKGISTTVISDSAVFALMSRVNKVIIGTHTVMANGGLLAWSGMHGLASAAHHHSVPVVVCTGRYKMSPLYPHDLPCPTDFANPADVLPATEAGTMRDVDVLNPTFDYIPPELVSLYITNEGGSSPSYIYRLLAEYYHAADVQL